MDWKKSWQEYYILLLWATDERWKGTKTIPAQRGYSLNYSQGQAAQKTYGHQGAPKSTTHKGPQGLWPVFQFMKNSNYILFL